MQRLQLREQPSQALVAARPRPAALEAEAVALADDVQVRKVRDAPRAAIGGAFIEMLEVAGLGHGRIGDPPDQRGSREIPGDQHDGSDCG
jgi:hypothetical protein